MAEPPISPDPIDESRIRELLSEPLPDYAKLRQQSRDLVAQITIGRSAFMHHYGVKSELEYKQQAMRDGHIMYHAHIGMNDISNTADALAQIHRELSQHGFRLDRAGATSFFRS